MHCDQVSSTPDLHRAQPLPYLHRGANPSPVDPVAGAFPTDEPVPCYLAVLPWVGSQRGPVSHFAQLGPLIGQHGLRRLTGGPVETAVGHRVALLQRLPVQAGITGEANAGPQTLPLA